MKIGNIITQNNIFLAPMAGVTDLAFRLICKKWGAGLVYSEMVSAKALHYGDKKTLELLKTSDQEAPLAVQIFGKEPDIMAESAKKIEDMGFKIIDINFGCPAPKITSNGEGSALLKDKKAMSEIVSKVKKSVSVPITCKIRCGYDEYEDVGAVSRILQDSGADAITVHGRTRKMFYSGKSDNSKIFEAKKAVSVPIIGNGDIACGKDAENMFMQTGCDAVMIGRAAQGNPFIFSEVIQYLKNTNQSFYISDEKRIEFMKEHFNLLIQLKGEKRGCTEARKHVAWYTKGMKCSSEFRCRIFKTESFNEMTEIIDSYKEFICGGNENQ